MLPHDASHNAFNPLPGDFSAGAFLPRDPLPRDSLPRDSSSVFPPADSPPDVLPWDDAATAPASSAASGAFRRQQIEIWLLRNPLHPQAWKWRLHLRVLGFVASRERSGSPSARISSTGETYDDPQFWPEPGVEPFVSPDVSETHNPARPTERLRGLLQRIAEEADEENW